MPDSPLHVEVEPAQVRDELVLVFSAEIRTVLRSFDSLNGFQRENRAGGLAAFAAVRLWQKL
jgi:hypothetical protein